MKRIALLMFFLIIGLISSQIIPLSFPDLPENFLFFKAVFNYDSSLFYHDRSGKRV